MAHEWNPGETKSLAIVLDGAEFSVEVDGQLLIGPVLDGDNISATTHGIFIRGNGAARFDAFTVSGD